MLLTFPYEFEEVHVTVIQNKITAYPIPSLPVLKAKFDGVLGVPAHSMGVGTKWS